MGFSLESAIVDVITSYSIHYTKLYDQKLDEYKTSNKSEVFDAEKYAGNVWENELPKALKSAVELTDLMDQLEENVITSYSIHYTKLYESLCVAFTTKRSFQIIQDCWHSG